MTDAVTSTAKYRKSVSTTVSELIEDEDADPRSGLDGPGGAANLTFVFAIVVAIRAICAYYSIIPDCDEVFNYWEPTHYVTHGFGLETWEYSPVYAIRSWAYIGIHSIVVHIYRLMGVSETNLFFALRALLGSFCAFCEINLYHAIWRNISARAAKLFLVFSVSATGMFHASVTFLPSTFSMYFTMLAFSYILDEKARYAPHRALFMFAISGVLGWPFALVIASPLILDVVWRVFADDHRRQMLHGILKVILYSLFLVVVVVAIDSFAFNKLHIVALNIVLYNVFGTEETGPNIFGTEPWTYYVSNLLLNFNAVGFLAYTAVLLWIIRSAVPASKAVIYPYISRGKLFSIISPLLLWTAIFFYQPHKEERFFYVVYPLLCLNAALAVDCSLAIFKSVLGKVGYSKSAIADWISSGQSLLLLAVVVFSFSRILALHSFYYAPLEVYGSLFNVTTLPGMAASDSPLNVCVGREWYRFPSSYFLPTNMRLKFIKSDFNGMLPTQFAEGVSWYEGASLIPDGLNNENLEEMSFYIDVDECHYLVDSNFSTPSYEGTFEKQFITDVDNWDIVQCVPFLDSNHSTLLARVFKLPDFIERLIPADTPYFHREWTAYCLLKRKTSAT
ncbi:Alg9-like mannosyltransferase family-domain-containing protein [Lipomyces kononenkoae]|uniref:Alg9-like mannosyltransferase family-domain-containing protein n=1 Tax=Lipomyces kononenkoae TaxID=34357 RepID=A0ACC3T675_LIPKO